MSRSPTVVRPTELSPWDLWLWGEPGTKDPKPEVTRELTRRRVELGLPTSAAEKDSVVAFRFGRRPRTGKLQYTFVRETGTGTPWASADIWLVFEHGIGEFDGFEDVILNGRSISTYSGSVFAWHYTGTTTQGVDPNLAAVDTSWDEDFIVRDASNNPLFGVAYSIIKIASIDQVFDDGRLPQIEFLYRGMKTWDERTGTRIYSTNPWSHWHEWAMHVQGRRLAPSQIDSARMITALNIADELMADGSKRYEGHLDIDKSADWRDWQQLFQLLTDGFMPETKEGVILPYSDRPAASAASYGRDALLEAYPPAGRPAALERPNHFIVRFTEAMSGGKWNDQAFEEWKTPAAEAGTDPLRPPALFEAPFVTNRGRARRMMIRAANRVVHDFTAAPLYRPIFGERNVGDVVTISIDTRGVTDQLMRVRDVERLPDGTCRPLLDEYNAALFSDDTVAEGSTIGSSVPSPNDPPPAPQNVSATLEEYVDDRGPHRRIRVTFDPIDYLYFRTVECVYSIDGGTERIVPSSRIGPFLIEAAEEGSYEITLRTVSTSGLRSADETRVVDGTVPASPEVGNLRFVTGGINARYSIAFDEPAGFGQYVREYRIYDNNSTDKQYTRLTPADVPTDAKPLDVEALAYRTKNLADGSATAACLVRVTVVSVAGDESAGATDESLASQLPTNTEAVVALTGDQTIEGNKTFLDMVGIGATPIERLYVWEDADVNTLIRVENPNAGPSAAGALQARSDAAGISVTAHGSGRTISRFGKVLGGWNEIVAFNGIGLIAGTTGAFPVVLGTNNLNRLEITADGNIGINTPTPRSTSGRNVHIKSTTAGAAARLLLDQDTGSGREYALFSDADGLFGVYDWDASAYRLVINPSGFVGINRQAPSTVLDVAPPAGQHGANFQGTLYYNFVERTENLAKGVLLGYDTAEQAGLIGTAGNANTSLDFYTRGASAWARALRIDENQHTRPGTTFTSDLGTNNVRWRSLYASELRVQTLIAQNTIATIGGRILVGPTTKLTADLTAGATTISVEHNEIAIGDRLYLETAPGGLQQVEFMAVTAGPTGAGPYTYTVTRNLDGTGANAWKAGDAVFNTGTTGDGFIDIYSIRGTKASAERGPTIVGNARDSATFNAWSPRWAVGNLNGLYGYSTDTYGAAFGVASGAWIKIDPTNGVRIGHNAATKISLDASGNASFSGSITASLGTIGGFSIGASELFAGSGATRVQLSSASGIWLGATAFGSAPFSVSPAGALKATSGTVGGFTLGATELFAGSGATRVQLSSASGIWLGATGFASAPFSVSPAGALKATSGTIGGFTIGATALFAGSGSTRVQVSSAGIWLGADLLVNAPFSVSPNGSLKATDGEIGGFEIGDSALFNEDGLNTIAMSTLNGFYCGHTTPSSAPFQVTPDGALRATNATIAGEITATSGEIGPWVLTSISLIGTTIGLNDSDGHISCSSLSATAVISTGAEYRRGATKLLGPRAPAIANADGTLADITTKFNTLLSYLSGAGSHHGLIG